MGRRLRRGMLWGGTILLLAPAGALADVDAEFTFSPASPVSGDNVTFTATSTSDQGPVSEHTWDFDNDGAFDDAIGSQVSRSFPAPGVYRIRLRTVAQNGDSDTRSRDVRVNNRPPTAAFSYDPSPPAKGEVVTFNSTSNDIDGSITGYAWDLDNDGAFDDATGPSTSRVFPASGGFTVRLEVTDDDGAKGMTAVSIPVIESREPPPPRFMTPFPIVRIQGRATRRGARISRLTVQAPAGSRVRVTCKGKRRRGCPKRAVNRTVAPRPDGRTPVIRIRRFQRRLRAGAIVRVFVTGEGVIGKYARFAIRRGRAPGRRDLCVMPGSSTPARCPSG